MQLVWDPFIISVLGREGTRKAGPVQHVEDAGTVESLSHRVLVCLNVYICIHIYVL